MDEILIKNIAAIGGNVWILMLLTVTYWSMVQDKRSIKLLAGKIDELIIALTKHEARHSETECKYKPRGKG